MIDETTLNMAMIFMLGMDRSLQTESLWQELEEELQVKNRFFPRSNLLGLIDKMAPQSLFILPKSKVKIYRSRLIDKKREILMLSSFYQDFYNLFPTYSIGNGDHLTGLANMVLYFLSETNQEIFQNEDYIKMKRKYSRKRFWGFSSRESDAPPIGYSSAGRINPKGICYLYAAEDIRTSILEVRPTITQFISVAEIELLRDVKLFNFNSKFEVDDTGKNITSVLDYNVISRRFSLPNYSGDEYYLATQYVSEFIKNMKNSDGTTQFDGLCFESSLNVGKMNYVFFDTGDSRCYKIRNSSVFQMKDLLGGSHQILPLSTD